MNSSPHSSPHGCTSSSTSRCGQWQVWGTIGVTSLSKTLTLVPTSQICPVIYHAGMVLLNSLLDTVPGELVLAGVRGSGSGPEAGMGVRRRLGAQLAHSTSEQTPKGMEPQLQR